MAYWWVSQNKTFEEEHAGGYLWAPEVDKGGSTPHHWSTMQRLAKGDVVFCYVGQHIVAVAGVDSAPYRSPRPFAARAAQAWETAGWRADVTYEFLEPPIRVATLLDRLQPRLPRLYSPLTEKGTGNQGYLFALPQNAGELLLEVVGLDSVESAGSSTTAPQSVVAPLEEVWLGRQPASGKQPASANDRGITRRSSRSKQVGDRAELVVLDHLRRTLPSAEAETLRHTAAEGRQPGWDIEYISAGALIAVEVKGTTLAQVGAVDITANEWAAAQRMGAHYCLAVVVRAESSRPTIAFEWDPWSSVSQQRLSATPSSWRIERLLEQPKDHMMR